MSADPVNPLATFSLFRDEVQAELLLEGPREGSAHSVRLPAGGFADLAHRRAFGTLQHPNYLCLLGVLARARRGVLRPCAPQRRIARVGDAPGGALAVYQRALV